VREPASTSISNPGLAGSRESRTDACAVLILDASGRISAANGSARALWQCGESELPGETFTSLFAFEVVSLDPDFHQAQWDVLLAGARDAEVVMTAQPREGSSREVRVRIERLLGGTDGYIATVQPIAENAPPGTPLSGPGADLFPLLATQGGVGFFDLNLTTGRVTFSPTWNRLLGYTATELPGTLETWHDLIHPDDSAAAPDKIGRKSGTGTRSFSAEFRLQHQRGHWVWVQCVGVQVINAAGELERVAGINLDITERKELEDTLVANDARLQDLSASGPLAAFELDYANRVFWFSPAFERLLGYGEGELPADPSSFAGVLPEEDAHAGVEAWAFGRAPGQTSFTETVTLRAKDGRPVPVVLGAHRTVNRKRELVRLLGFACPLPVSTTDANAPRVNLTETAFNTLAEGVLITDSRRRIVFANATAARLLHADSASLRGQPVGDVLHLVRRQTQAPADDPVDLALSGVGALPLYSDDALAARPDGQPPTPVVWTARAAFASDGVPQGVVIVFRNPEEMTLTPEELVKANRFESLGLLAGEIAHDINNLLTTVLGAVSMGRDNRDYTALGDAEQACLTAKALTKQLLAFAKGSGGTQVVCAPKGILEDAVKMASAGSSAAIVLQVADDIHPVQVDRSQILQVFQNLIINALQAMPAPPHQARVLVRAANATLAEGQVPALVAGEYVEFEVRDNGSGIPPEHVEKIFDPFFTTKKHGTGLGLATVLSIVRKHGGQVALDTQVGVGTAFTVYIPKTDGPLEVQARRAASLRFGTGRILFMDDDANISTLTGKMLESLDYKYDLARDGDEALALYRRYLNIGRPYDAVILDLNVVGAMGGEACFTEMRKLDPEVRAIVASGYDNDDIARKFLDQGFCGYLTKPYRVSDLGKVLKTVLG
jgi:two-component system cell cycle sensor histidine kinase/response regulator CckA